MKQRKEEQEQEKERRDRRKVVSNSLPPWPSYEAGCSLVV